MASYYDDDEYDENEDEMDSSPQSKNQTTQSEAFAKFNLSQIYHELDDADLKSFDIQNNVCAILGSNNQVVINDMDVSSASNTVKHLLPGVGHKIFLDPKGRHCLVSSTTGDLFYFNPSNKIKCARVHLSSGASPTPTGFLSAVSGAQSTPLPNAIFIVESIGWDMTNQSNTSTGDILIGSKVGGLIYRLRVDGDSSSKEVKSQVTPYVTLTDPSAPVTSIDVGVWLGKRRDSPSEKGACSVTISTKSRIFHGVGKSLFEAAKQCGECHREEKDKDVDTAGYVKGRLAVFRPTCKSAFPQSFVWSNQTGIYHGSFRHSINDPTATKTAFASNQQVLFGKKQSGGFEKPPHDIQISAFHMYLLYEDRLVVINHPAGMTWRSKTSRSAAASDSQPARNDDLYASARMGRTSSLAPPSQTNEKTLHDFDFADRIRIEAFRNRKVKLVNIVRDVTRRRVFVCSSQYIWEIEIQNQEHAGQWRHFIERALDPSEPQDLRDRYFEAAYKFTKKKPSQNSAVAFAMGKYYLESDRPDEAAKYFSESRRFEDIILLLMGHNDQTVLLRFIENRLKLMQKAVDRPGSALRKDSQLACLTILAGQLHVEHLAAVVDPPNAVRPQGMMPSRRALPPPSEGTIRQAEGEMLTFWKEAARKQSKLFSDQKFYNIVTRLLSSQGCTTAMLELSEETRRFRYTLLHYINAGDYDHAVKVLRTRCCDLRSAGVWYEFAPQLILHRPVGLIRGLYKVKPEVTTDYNPERLIPAFINYTPALNEDHSDEHATIEYLSLLFRKGALPSRVLQNMLISMLLNLIKRLRDSDRDDEIPMDTLTELLKTEQANYTVEFALRKCIEANQLELSVILYERLQMYDEAVIAALGNKKADAIERAKKFVKELSENSLRTDAATRKSLWLHIAAAVTQNAGTREALEVITESNGALRLEDVLSSFGDENQVIQDFKEEICKSLDDYAKGIDELRTGMEEATKLAEYLKEDDLALTHQFGYITASQRCEQCNKTLLRNASAKPFVVYPSCRHAFHEDCINLMYAKLPANVRAAIAMEMDLDGEPTLDAMREAECPFCGEYMIVRCQEPFQA